MKCVLDSNVAPKRGLLELDSAKAIRIRHQVLKGIQERGVRMEEILTIDEMKARYAPDWVLIGEPQTDEFKRLHAGKVLFHGPDREEVYRKAIELRPGRFAFRHLGELPEDMAFAL